MKTFLSLFLALGLSFSAFAQDTTESEYNPNRTWTSADGTSTFKGKITKYDEKKEKITISPAGKASITADISKFSEEDKEWVEKNKEFIGKSGSELKALIHSNKVCPVAKPMKKMRQINADTVKLKTNAKYYLVLFSASWCPPCRAEAPHIQKEYAEAIANNPDIELVLMSADRDVESALKWAEKENMTFPIFLDGSKYNSIPGIAENRSGYIPHMIILDSNGKLMHKSNPSSLFKSDAKYKNYCKPSTAK